MQKAVAIIINGLPATGKTTLAHRLAEKLCLPLFYKDGIKELLFNQLGWSDRDWSRQVCVTSITILEHIITSQLQARQSFIAESYFHPQFANHFFQQLLSQYPFTLVQILCTTNEATRHQRFFLRASTGERHPGHAELQNITEFSQLHQTPPRLDLNGPFLEIDTTDFSHLDYARIIEDVQQIIAHIRMH